MSSSAEGALSFILGAAVSGLREMGREPAELRAWLESALTAYERRGEMAAESAALADAAARLVGTDRAR